MQKPEEGLLRFESFMIGETSVEMHNLQQQCPKPSLIHSVFNMMQLFLMTSMALVPLSVASLANLTLFALVTDNCHRLFKAPKHRFCSQICLHTVESLNPLTGAMATPGCAC